MTQTLGKYEVVKHLANGGMAEVLLARSRGIEGFERHVVIKRIRTEQARDEQYVKMFLDEARLAAMLHHPNIVQVHDIGQEGGEYFFAMEYVHGEDLRKLLTEFAARNEKIPFNHLITIVTSAAAGLHYAHERKGPGGKPLGIVHRDVSPANILVGYEGNVKIADFGIAKAAARSSETRSGTLKGKVAYMSPEQCKGSPIDRRSDVFALGIVLYELSTTRRLFKGNSDFMTMTTIVSGNLPKPSQHRPDMPPALEQIILKALALEPDDRFQSCDELRIALERVATTENIRTSTTGLADYVTQVLGAKPEPWTIDEGPKEAVDVDFDGAGSQPSRPAVSSTQRLDTSGLRASLDEANVVAEQLGQRRDATPAPGTRAPTQPVRAATEPGSNPSVASWSAGQGNPATGSGTPMAWTPGGPSQVGAVAPASAPAEARRRGLVIGGVTAGVLGLAVVLMTATGRSSSTPVRPAEPGASTVGTPPGAVEPGASLTGGLGPGSAGATSADLQTGSGSGAAVVTSPGELSGSAGTAHHVGSAGTAHHVGSAGTVPNAGVTTLAGSGARAGSGAVATQPGGPKVDPAKPPVKPAVKPPVKPPAGVWNRKSLFPD